MEKFFLVVIILTLSMLIVSFLQYRSMPKTILGKLWCIVVATTVVLSGVGLVLTHHSRVHENQPSPRDRPLLPVRDVAALKYLLQRLPESGKCLTP